MSAGGCNDEKYWGEGRDRVVSIGGQIHTRDTHAVILALPRERCLAQRGGYYEKSLIVAATIVAHCVFPLPLGAFLQLDMGDEGY